MVFRRRSAIDHIANEDDNDDVFEPPSPTFSDTTLTQEEGTQKGSESEGITKTPNNIYARFFPSSRGHKSTYPIS